MSSQVKSRKWFSRSTWRKRMRSWCRWLDSNRWVWVLMAVICFYNDFTFAWLFCCCSPGSFQIKDILKGALRFNQSQLEAEENEEITIADDHYTSTAAAETIINHHQQASSRQSQDSVLDASTEEKEGKEQAMTPPEQQVKSTVSSGAAGLCRSPAESAPVLVSTKTQDYFSVVWRFNPVFNIVITDHFHANKLYPVCKTDPIFAPEFLFFFLCRITPCDPKAIPLGMNQSQNGAA